MALVFLLIMNMDVFLAVRQKVRIQNAGDSAALAAARWQGVTLNLIGDLNLAHLAVACSINPKAPDELNEALESYILNINALQERIAFAGPLIGLRRANELAIRNGSPPDRDMTELVNVSIQTAPIIVPDTPLWENKGLDYAHMIRGAASAGIAAAADNALYFTCNGSGNHILYNYGFYQAVKSRDWCWFCRYFGGHEAAISWLSNFSGWGEIPEPDAFGTLPNSEFFGVHIMPGSVNNFTNDVNANAAQVLSAVAEEYGLSMFINENRIFKSGALARPKDTWFFYNSDQWRTWNEIDPVGHDRFPLLSTVKEEYDVSGASASCRVTGKLVPFSDAETTNTFVWTAAAKPFGRVDAFLGTRRVIDLFSKDGSSFFPQNAPLVLPSFTFARLIPLGGTNAHNQGNPEWMNHVRSHIYLGNIQEGGCKYCLIMKQCVSGFLSTGAEWLSEHPHDEVCAVPGNGPGPDRGTRYAH
ncbi:MAG: hypothetical protein J6V88_05740 [Kiritimatiellae bacterium]|nr:hypothetical protein [Kiritimatiellia bacterium]